MCISPLIKMHAIVVIKVCFSWLTIDHVKIMIVRLVLNFNPRTLIPNLTTKVTWIVLPNIIWTIRPLILKSINFMLKAFKFLLAFLTGYDRMSMTEWLRKLDSANHFSIQPFFYLHDVDSMNFAQSSAAYTSSEPCVTWKFKN